MGKSRRNRRRKAERGKNKSEDEEGMEVDEDEVDVGQTTMGADGELESLFKAVFDVSEGKTRVEEAIGLLLDRKVEERSLKVLLPRLVNTMFEEASLILSKMRLVRKILDNCSIQDTPALEALLSRTLDYECFGPEVATVSAYCILNQDVTRYLPTIETYLKKENLPLDLKLLLVLAFCEASPPTQQMTDQFMPIILNSIMNPYPCEDQQQQGPPPPLKMSLQLLCNLCEEENILKGHLDQILDCLVRTVMMVDNQDKEIEELAMLALQNILGAYSDELTKTKSLTPLTQLSTHLLSRLNNDPVLLEAKTSLLRTLPSNLSPDEATHLTNLYDDHSTIVKINIIKIVCSSKRSADPHSIVQFLTDKLVKEADLLVSCEAVDSLMDLYGGDVVEDNEARKMAQEFGLVAKLKAFEKRLRKRRKEVIGEAILDTVLDNLGPFCEYLISG